jgi:SOS-response transcriptional repressor LexA
MTLRQGEVLRTIDRLFSEYGRSPTLRELGAALEINSTNGVDDHLIALEQRGLIVRATKEGWPVARNISITAAGREALGQASKRAQAIAVLRSAGRPDLADWVVEVTPWEAA